MARQQVICLGEAMGELAFPAGQPARIGIGGDTFNTAVYLARLGVATGFASCIGEDPIGAMIAADLDRHGVSAALLRQTAGTTGIYAIATDAKGERRFSYWRDSSAARSAFDAAPQVWLEGLIAGECLYLSGISLWVFLPHIEPLLSLLTAARAKGCRVLFDGNFRPRLWQGQEARAKTLFAQVLALTDIAFPTHEDEVALWGDASPAATGARMLAAGVRQVVLKQGKQGCLIFDAAGVLEVPVPGPVQPVDTTAAGDSFNAGFIAAILANPADPQAAALQGHRLAAQVIQHPGAILPPEVALDVMDPSDRSTRR